MEDLGIPFLGDQHLLRVMLQLTSGVAYTAASHGLAAMEEK